MSKSRSSLKGQRVHCQKQRRIRRRSPKRTPVVIGRTMQIVYGSCGEQAFADDCRLSLSMTRLHFGKSEEKSGKSSAS